MVTSCPACGRRFKANDNLVGKRTACPGCKKPFIISPEATGASAPERRVTSGQTGGPASQVLPPPLPKPAARGVLPRESLRPSGDTGAVVQGTAPALAATQIQIGRYRHPKETTYFILAAVISAIAWIIALPFAIIGLVVWLLAAAFAAPFLPYLIPVVLFVAFFRWALWQSRKARLFGSSVRVSEAQHKEVYDTACQMSARLGIGKAPHIFLINSQGAVNAVARKMMGSRYVILYSSLVDLMLSSGHNKELGAIIGHELAHHAAGHVSHWKHFFLRPAMCVPFLGAAYGRACELTADRISLVLVGDADAAKRALGYLAGGSMRLSPEMSLDAFMRQELDIPQVIRLVCDMYSSHPRTTKRVVELDKYARQWGTG